MLSRDTQHEEGPTHRTVAVDHTGGAVNLNVHNHPVSVRPKYVYKFMCRKFAESFVNHGTMRIGTLWDYRREEELGEYVGDRDEGAIRTLIPVNGRGGQAFPVDLRSQFSFDDSHFFSGCQVRYTQDTVDMYTYCTCEHGNISLCKDMSYDTVVSIRDPFEFFSRHVTPRVRKAHGGELAPYMFVPVRYEGKEFSVGCPQARVLPALLKDQKYSSQMEIRAMWQPKIFGKFFALRPKIIHVPESRIFCKIEATR